MYHCERGGSLQHGNIAVVQSTSLCMCWGLARSCRVGKQPWKQVYCCSTVRRGCGGSLEDTSAVQAASIWHESRYCVRWVVSAEWRQSCAGSQHMGWQGIVPDCRAEQPAGQPLLIKATGPDLWHAAPGAAQQAQPIQRPLGQCCRLQSAACERCTQALSCRFKTWGQHLRAAAAHQGADLLAGPDQDKALLCHSCRLGRAASRHGSVSPGSSSRQES